MADTNQFGDPMLQAEVGGGARIDPGEAVQRPGYVIRDFVLNSVQGERIQISDYRGRANLVVVFAAEPANSWPALRELAEREEELKDQDAFVVVILSQAADLSGSLNSRFLLLVDEHDRVHKLSGAADQNGRPATIIYVTDRFGEIVSVHQGLGGEGMPSADELLKLLEFINHQCPECEPPEWPR